MEGTLKEVTSDFGFWLSVILRCVAVGKKERKRILVLHEMSSMSEKNIGGARGIQENQVPEGNTGGRFNKEKEAFFTFWHWPCSR